MPEPLLLDACDFINLLASGHLAEIADANDVQFILARIAADESFYLDAEVPGGERESIDMDALERSGVITRVELADEMLETFVELAAKVDDGEAATITLAIHRGWTMATDDRKARAVVTRDYPSVTMNSSSELLRRWADSGAAPKAADVALAIQRIRTRAHFIVNRTDPQYEWWMLHLA